MEAVGGSEKEYEKMLYKHLYGPQYSVKSLTPTTWVQVDNNDAEKELV